MNEDQNLQNLFQRIESNVAASPELRTKLATKRRSPRRLRLAMAGGMVGAFAVLGAIVFILPNASAAGTYRRVEDAIEDAKYMHVRSYGKFVDKPRTLLSELFYSHGAWRCDAFPNTRLARTYLRVGGDQWYYLNGSDVAVKEPFTGGFLDSRQTALEFAENMSDEGSLGHQRDFSIESRPDEGGRPVYAIVATRKDTPYHLEMIVDKKSNLPIRATFSGQDPSSPNYREITSEFSFDNKIDPRAFLPKIKSTTRLTDMIADAESLKTEWKRPIKTVQAGPTSVDVRNITVNSKGELFVVCSFGAPVGFEPGQFPKNLLPDKITDDLGRAYQLVETVPPGGMFGDTRAREYFKFGDDSVAITEWAPIEPITPWVAAKSVDVSFVVRTWMGYPTFSDDSIRAKAQFTLPSAIESDFPAYSASMLLGEVHGQFEMESSEDRAKRCESNHQYALAARWYRAAAELAYPLALVKTFTHDAERCQKLLDAHPVP